MGDNFLYRDVAGPLKEHIVSFFFTFCIFCMGVECKAGTGMGLLNTYTHHLIQFIVRGGFFPPRTIQVHKMAT